MKTLLLLSAMLGSCAIVKYPKEVRVWVAEGRPVEVEKEQPRRRHTLEDMMEKEHRAMMDAAEEVAASIIERDGLIEEARRKLLDRGFQHD